jgi:hypothetical protein
VHRRTELLEVLGRRNSARWALSQCADRHRREENSLSSGSWKEESTEGSSQGC